MPKMRRVVCEELQVEPARWDRRSDAEIGHVGDNEARRVASAVKDVVGVIDEMVLRS